MNHGQNISLLWRPAGTWSQSDHAKQHIASEGVPQAETKAYIDPSEAGTKHAIEFVDP
jgi:hypothetical protein